MKGSSSALRIVGPCHGLPGMNSSISSAAADVLDPSRADASEPSVLWGRVSSGGPVSSDGGQPGQVSSVSVTECESSAGTPTPPCTQSASADFQLATVSSRIINAPVKSLARSCEASYVEVSGGKLVAAPAAVVNTCCWRHVCLICRCSATICCRILAILMERGSGRTDGSRGSRACWCAAYADACCNCSRCRICCSCTRWWSWMNRDGVGGTEARAGGIWPAWTADCSCCNIWAWINCWACCGEIDGIDLDCCNSVNYTPPVSSHK